MKRILLGCALALSGTVGLELHAFPSPARPQSAATAAPHQRRPDIARPSNAEMTGLATSILGRPLFSPGRRPDATPRANERLPRLAGLLLSPRLRLALLQTSDADGVRADTVVVGGEIAGWRLAALDRQSVLLRRGKRSVWLALRPAGARQAPPVPMDQIVLMPTKRTNPQLAW